MSGTDKSDALTLEKALAEEYAAVTGDPEPAPTLDPENPGAPPAHKLEDIQRAHFSKGTAALCLSGGGIRSAAFALGVMQGLAKRGLLKRFHYLSTVSGGGYAGSFASAWVYRAEGGIAEVERELARPKPEPRDGNDEQDALRRLRRYSNYLSPRAGLLSLDTWTLIVTYLRNLALNWVLLLPLLALVVCVPFLVHAVFTASIWKGWSPLEYAGVLLTALGLFVLRWRTYSTSSVRVFKRRVRFDWIVLSLLFIGAILVAVDFHMYFNARIPGLARENPGRFAGQILICGFLLGLLFIAIDMNRVRLRPVTDRSLLVLAFGFTAFLAGFAAIIWVVFFQWIGTLGAESGGAVGSILAHSRPNALMVILAPPAWLTLLLVPEVMFLGIAASLSDDHDREWWTRNVAFALRTCVAWVLAGALVLLGPGVFDMLKKFEFVRSVTSSIDLPALIASLSALLGGLIARRNFMREATGTAADPVRSAARRRWTDALANAGGALLIVAVFAGIAYYVREVLQEMRPSTPASDDWMDALRAPELLVSLGLLLWCLGFGVTVHVNRYSLHSMYRDRLSRTFLSASRKARAIPVALLQLMGDVMQAAGAGSGLLGRAVRFASRMVVREAEPPPEVWQFTPRDPDKFTDFDRNDNPLMQWLDPRRRGGTGIYGYDEVSPDFVRAPLHVVNCALNMVGERDNAIQERKAASFTFTPLHAGSARTGFRPVAEYGGPDGVTLGTALTISGAAVSPNAGQRSHPVSTFLMTLFNARLGWWLGHPKNAENSRRTGPLQSLVPLIDEMLGRTNSGGDWVYLSDGGHFENLGLYEMVRRGCRYIVVADASADPQRNFDDLGNAIRKIRLDLSVEIREVETFGIGDRSLGDEGRYAALFEIEYPWDDQRLGQLLYLKTALYKGNPLGAPMDVVEYGNRSPDFPHEPTSDQFFMETQFESYRALGEHEMTAVMLQTEEHVPALFAGAREHVVDPFEKEVEK